MDIVSWATEQLFSMQEISYREFSSKLIPGTDNLIGVRITKIRAIAKEIVNKNPYEYLQNATDTYFEQTMLQGLVIGQLKNIEIEELLKLIQNFIPKINNWSVCDTFCSGLKVVKKNKEVFWEFLKTYTDSKQTYDVRFSVVMMLCYYIDSEYLPKLFNCFNDIKHENYYVKMSVAWAVSKCFVKFPKETMDYLKNNNLDNETYNKSLQKIRESTCVNKQIKIIIKKMKR